MSNEVDDRIVSIQFDNASFERHLTETLKSLDKLTEKLSFKGAERGFNDVSKAADSVNLGHMADSVDHIASRFTALGAVGLTAIAHLTSGALDFVKKVGGDILSPILGGGKQRAINLEQARFLFEGIGIDVQKGMDSALAAVKGTAFGLDEAAKIAAQFGASGIKAGEDMTGALRGVAGVAALTGKSFSEIGDIFASSAGTGVVNNQDLLQFATRGLNAADAVGKVLGKTQEQVHEMATNGELDFKTFANAMNIAFGQHATEANKTFTGALANLHAAMSRLGASFEAPKLTQQRDLFNALTPVIDNVSGALQPLIGAYLLLRRVGTNRLIGSLSKLNINPFKEGIANISIGLVHMYQALKPIGKALESAFHQVFSGNAGKTFVGLAKHFKNFAASVKIGADTLKKIKDIFRGFFAALEIGFEIVKGIVGTIGAVLKALLPAGSKLLGFGSDTGNMITRLNNALVKGGGIKRFFETLTEVLTHPIEFIQRLQDKLLAFFSGISISATGPIKFLQDIRDKIFNFFGIFSASDAAQKGLARVNQRVEQLGNIWDRVKENFNKVTDFLQPVLDYITNWFKSLGQKIADAFQPGDFNAALDVVNVGLLGGIALLIRKFVNNGLKLDIGKGVFDKITGALDQLTSTLKSMQANLKAQALEKIAIAIAILTASLVVLSLIDSAKLTKALLALSVSFGELIGALTLLDKLNFSASILKLNGIATAMILIAGAAIVLSIAITILSRLDAGKLAKGLTGVGVGLAILVTATRSITADTGGLISAGVAMIAISLGLIVLAKAVQAFAAISFGDMAKGLAGVAVGLGLIATAMNFMPPASVLSGAGFIEIAVGLTLLAGAVKLFSLMSFSEMGKGLLGIAGGLLVIAVAMNFMPINLPITAAGILILSVALGIMAAAVKSMGNADFGTLAKGIGAFAAMLLILVVAVNAMTGAIVGAAALIIVAEAMKILAKVLVTLGELSLGQLAGGLLAVAAVLATLGIAAALLGPVIPEMLALGLALSALGIAFTLFGVGAILVAKAFEIMAVSGAAGAKGIVKAISIIATAIPTIEKAIFEAVVGFAKEILHAAPLLVRLFQALIEQLIETVIDLAPKVGKAVATIVIQIVEFVKRDYPKLIEAGAQLLLGFLKGIRDHIGEITTTVADIIINFLDAFNEKIPEIVDSLARVIRTIFVQVVTKLTGIGLILGPTGRSLIGGLLKGLLDKVKDVFNFFISLPGKLVNIVKKALGINSPSTVFAKIGVDIIAGLLQGLVNKIKGVITFFTSLGGKILSWVGDLGRTLFNKGIQIIKGFFNGIISMANTIKTWVSQLPGRIKNWIGDGLGVLKNVGVNIIAGLWNGIVNRTTQFVSDIKQWIEDHIPGVFKKILNIKSPSKVMAGIGENIAKGLTKGLLSFSPSREMIKIAKTVPEGVIAGISSMDPEVEKASFGLSQTILNAFGNIDDNINPTIAPVLDLTNIESASDDIARLMTVPNLKPDVSLSQARDISTTSQTAQNEPPVVVVPPPNVSFVQNNNSPKALATNDIYRNTKSQFAKVKEELGLT